MSSSSPDEKVLLKTVLEPLLADFEHWFARSRTLLESESLDFLGDTQQAALLARVCDAQEQVRSAKILFQATGGQAGVEMNVLMPWHHLVTEC